jgi:mRNA export factor
MFQPMGAAAPQDFQCQGNHQRGRGIAALCFKPTAAAAPQEQLAAASWDNKVYLYNVATNQHGQCSQGAQAAECAFQAPVLDCVYGTLNSAYANHVFAGCADNGLYMVQNGTQATKLGQFGAPVSAVRCVNVNNTPLVAAAGWDRTVKYFDPRQNTGQPVIQAQLSERVYCMDAKNVANGAGGVLVACTADRNCHVFDLNRPQQPVRQPAPSVLKMPPRCVDVFIDCAGYSVGSVEGRIAVIFFNDNPSNKKSFAFKCHRGNPKQGDMRVFPVNNIKSTRFGTFASCGSDGVYNFWDKGSMQRLKARTGMNPQNPTPIAAIALNSASTILAYTESYDWFKGAQHANTFGPPKLLLHAVPPKDAMPKPKKR